MKASKRQIADLHAKGLNDAQIAARLGVRSTTIQAARSVMGLPANASRGRPVRKVRACR